MTDDTGSFWHVILEVESENVLVAEEESCSPPDRGENIALFMATLLAIKVSLASEVLWSATDRCSGGCFCWFCVTDAWFSELLFEGGEIITDPDVLWEGGEIDAVAATAWGCLEVTSSEAVWKQIHVSHVNGWLETIVWPESCCVWAHLHSLCFHLSPGLLPSWTFQALYQGLLFCLELPPSRSLF